MVFLNALIMVPYWIVYEATPGVADVGVEAVRGGVDTGVVPGGVPALLGGGPDRVTGDEVAAFGFGGDLTEYKKLIFGPPSEKPITSPCLM